MSVNRSANHILSNMIAKRGWSDSTCLTLCLNYIDAQHSNEAFEDFLEQVAEEDDSFSEWRARGTI